MSLRPDATTKRLVSRTVLPALLAIGLFSGALFFWFLPALSRAVQEQKRLMIRELTESSWNILARFEAEERTGELSRAEAQRQAIAQIRSLHYGQEGKDYFWVNDMQPRMLVHPYRPDLEGQGLEDFTDPHGKRIFVEMAETVRAHGAGYVRYMWQWKDDPSRIVPKLSYVKGFAPWGWIIGTGVYTDDIDAEVATITSELQAVALLILAIVSVLLFVLLRTSFAAERGRMRAIRALRDSEEKYRSLVESAGESIFMALEGERLYANASLLRLTGHDEAEFGDLDVRDFVLPSAEEIESGRRYFDAVIDERQPQVRYEAELAAKEGRRVPVMLVLSRIVVQGRAGFMAVATRIAQPRELDLDKARNPDELAAANKRMATMTALMVTHGTEALQVSRMLSSHADLVVRRGVEFALAELGPAPVDFDVLVLGSLGRSEVSLSADQDHGIVFASSEGRDEETVRRYFLRLGRRLADILDLAGYPYCRGGIMASEPDCCLSLEGWIASFAERVHSLTPADLMHSEIYYDFRAAHGTGTLTRTLRERLTHEIASEPRFLHLLAQNLLQYEPPLSPFGGFVLEEGEGEVGTFDIKGVLAQFVDYVRLRALQHGIPETNTLARLHALESYGHLHEATARETAESFAFLMQLRLRHQAQLVLEQREADNRIAPELLDDAERKRLKAVFTQLRALQSGLGHEFLGT